MGQEEAKVVSNEHSLPPPNEGDETPFLDHNGDEEAAQQQDDEEDFNPQDDTNTNEPGPAPHHDESLTPNPEDQTSASPPMPHQIQGYDPNRIPASIFCTKPTTPGEWSVASNESLFSIQMGNNSFSRDYAILFGKSGDLSKIEDIGKSNEFPRLEEWNKDDNNNNNNSNDNDNDNNNNINPQSKHVAAKSSEVAVLPPVMEESNSMYHAEGISRFEHVENRGEVETKSPRSCPSPSPSTMSDVGNNSCNSFVFPVLVKDGSKKGNSSVTAVPEIPEQPKPESRPEAPKEGVSDNPVIVEDRGWCSYFMCWPNNWLSSIVKS